MLVMVPGERHHTHSGTYIHTGVARGATVTKYQLLLRQVCAYTLLTDTSKQALFATDQIAGDLSAARRSRKKLTLDRRCQVRAIGANLATGRSVLAQTRLVFCCACAFLHTQQCLIFVCRFWVRALFCYPA